MRGSQEGALTSKTSCAEEKRRHKILFKIYDRLLPFTCEFSCVALVEVSLSLCFRTNAEAF